jgi:hypothetical protein
VPGVEAIPIIAYFYSDGEGVEITISVS